MPQREPLTAPLLGSLFAVSGLFAGWLVLALEAVVEFGLGPVVGSGVARLVLEPPFGLPEVVPGAGPALPNGPWAWAGLLLAGPLATMLAGAAVHAVAEAFQAAAWLRALAFEAFAFAWLRLPLLMLAAGLPGGRGSLARLYEHLGEPESGRWAAIALGLVLLWGIASLVAWRAVEVGRGWLRVDGRTFRRRVVRVVAAYPFVIATAAYALVRPTLPPGWLLVALAATVVCLTMRTT